MFWIFGPEVCGTLTPWPGIEPACPASEGKVLTTEPPGKSLLWHFFFFFLNPEFSWQWNELFHGKLYFSSFWGRSVNKFEISEGQLWLLSTYSLCLRLRINVFGHAILWKILMVYFNSFKFISLIGAITFNRHEVEDSLC